MAGSDLAALPSGALEDVAARVGTVPAQDRRGPRHSGSEAR